MNSFTFCSPTKIVFGRKVTDRVSEELAVAGYTRALIVYGRGSAVYAGTLARVTASLDAAGISHVELGGVHPSPEVGLMREGVALARTQQADVISPPSTPPSHTVRALP